MTQDSPQLGMVLLEREVQPPAEAIAASAARRGITLLPSSGEGAGERPSAAFDVQGGGWVAVMMIGAPHPEAAQMPQGITSPEPSVIAASGAHCIVAAKTPTNDVRNEDAWLARLVASVAENLPGATAAMLGQGAVFHRADLFIDAASTSDFPFVIAVDITAAPEPGDRISFLTHGLNRYGREEFYVTASQHGQGALDYVYALAEWMFTDSTKVLPTGDTVGRTPEEKILIQRVPSPVPDRPDVIRLDLDMDQPGASGREKKRRGFFRR